MFTVNEIVLSAREGDIIDHRLAVPDCIADALENLHDRKTVLDSVNKLLPLTRNHVIPTASLSESDADVLADCIEGSTWVAAAFTAAHDEGKPEIRSKAVRAITGLAMKLRKAGIPVETVPIR